MCVESGRGQPHSRTLSRIRAFPVRREASWSAPVLWRSDVAGDWLRCARLPTTLTAPSFRPLGNPGANQSDFLRRQWSRRRAAVRSDGWRRVSEGHVAENRRTRGPGRHVMVPNPANFQNEVALVALAWKNDRPILAALHDRLKAVQPQAALLAGLAVARNAIWRQNGTDVRGGK